MISKLHAFCVTRPFRENPWEQEFIENLTEYWAPEIAWKSDSFHFVDSIDEALQIATRKSDGWALIFRMGNSFRYNAEFLDSLKPLLKEDILCFGHILDRKDRYYEIHSQCLCVNIQNYRQIGAPPYLTPKGAIPLQKVERSADNFHDDYTPLSIGPGHGVDSFSNPANGAMIVSKALAAGYQVIPFNDQIRNAKVFTYWNDQFYDSKQKIISHAHRDLGRFFAANTESVARNAQVATLGRLITPAAGLNPFTMLHQYGQTLSPDRKPSMVLYDISPVALHVFESLLSKWDGVDYPNYVSKNFKHCLKNKQPLDPYWNEFLAQFGGLGPWLDWFSILKSRTEFEFYQTDILNRDAYAVPHWIRSHPDGDTLMNISNIFHYLSTKIHFPYRILVPRLNELIQSIAVNSPKMWCLGKTVQHDGSRESGGSLIEFFIQAERFVSFPTPAFPWSKGRGTVKALPAFQ